MLERLQKLPGDVEGVKAVGRAARELCSSAKSIPRIAGEVGYESEASLSRAFKRVMGVPPATWRRQRT